MTIEPQPAPPEPVKITTELLDYLDGLYAGTVEAAGPVLIPVQELVAAARLGTAWAEAEAALPEKTALQVVTSGPDGPEAERYRADARAWGEKYPDEKWADADSPVAALLALTEKLRTP